MRILRRVFWIAVFAGAVFVCVRFPARNATPVAVDYLMGVTPELPLWGVLVAAFVLGAVCAGVVAFLKVARLQLVARRYRNAVHGLESEVHQLRNLPLAPTAPGEALPEPQSLPPAEQALERGA